MNYLKFTLTAILLISIPLKLQAADQNASHATGLTFETDYAVVEHNLKVRIHPTTHRLQVEDKITLPVTAPREVIFSLHAGLQPVTPTTGVTVTALTQSADELQQSFKVKFAEQLKTFTLHYEGQINHPLESYGKEQARGFRSTPGLISTEGVFLAGSSVWFPQFESYQYLRFKMQVESPAGWKTVSQGKRVSDSESKDYTVDNWDSQSPQEEIYLIAAPFIEYDRQTGNINAQVFLRQPDQALANKYLDATAKYVTLYEKLIGDYPYSKFALVENFWETGYGMPSFTLLGSRVIRLPFIINSSYPHEILHNWWGNGVYVDFPSGNWSEGLTAYLADHLIKQQQGQSASYRLQSLQKYNDYAANSRDFPLTQFRGRHSSATEAVGYGKTLMLFHMLRNKTGDSLFIQSLQQFYRDYQFKIASFDDLRLTFETVSGIKLDDFFSQWIARTGAPDLRLGHSDVIKQGNQYHLKFELKQTQPDEVYHLEIPVAVTIEGQKKAQQSFVVMTQKNQQFDLSFAARPIRLDIDPEFDLFRHLAMEETPAAFTQLFGAHDMLVILPRSANPQLKKAWQVFATDLSRMGPDSVIIKWDDELESLPQNMAITVLGWNNRYANELISSLSDYDVMVKPDHLQIDNSEVPHQNHSIALVSRDQHNGNTPGAFIATDLPAALPGLGRKLPHYHKYSYLAFSGDEPQIKLKGRWPVNHSPMTALYDNNTKRGELAMRPSLAEVQIH